MIRAAVVFVALGAALLAGARHLVELELADGPRLRARARDQERKTFVLPAVRGSILDARGRQLVSTSRQPCVFADPSLITNFAFEAAAIAEILEVDPRWLESELLRRRETRYWVIARQVREDQAEAVRDLVRHRRTRAFGIKMENWRHYSYGRLASHVLGFVGFERTGLAGIEQRFDDLLRGRDGRRRSMVDARSRRIRQLTDETEPAVDGASVILTLDATIQQSAEAHLGACVSEFSAAWGVAIVMDPWSGEVLACAVAPSYDPLDPSPDRMDEDVAAQLRINHAVASAVEPGSIFKPFIASAAVDGGLITIDEELEIDGPVRSWRGRRIHDFKRHEWLPLWGVLAQSSNIGMGILGDRVGNERLYEYVRRFGFGEPTGVRLPGEAWGTVRPLELWDDYSTQSIPIGQEMAATPLQVIAAFSALCNDGILYRPRIVRGVLGADGETLEDCSRPIPIRRVLEPEVVRAVREQGLRAVVEEGTGRRAQLDGWQVFGKTGTGQIDDRVNGGYLEDLHTASFVCGAPLENPRISVLVSIYKAQTEEDGGGKLAAPVAKLIVADTLAYLEGPVPPRDGVED